MADSQVVQLLYGLFYTAALALLHNQQHTSSQPGFEQEPHEDLLHRSLQEEYLSMDVKALHDEDCNIRREICNPLGCDLTVWRPSHLGLDGTAGRLVLLRLHCRKEKHLQRHRISAHSCLAPDTVSAIPVSCVGI